MPTSTRSTGTWISPWTICRWSRPPGAAAGMDVNAAGEGIIREQRLYQLIRGQGQRERTFRIEFLDPGARAFAFTFG